MSAISTMVAAMTAAGCSAELINAAVQAHEAAMDDIAEKKKAARRAGNAERQRRWRDRNAHNENNAVMSRDGALCGVTGRDEPSQVSPPRDINSTPSFSPSDTPLIASQSSPQPGGERGRAKPADGDFERFYRAYPKHVDPQAAKRKFETVVRSGADPDRLIAAAERFANAHRKAGTEKQFIPAPAVWLNKGGYDSEDLPLAGQSRGPPGSRPQAGLSYGQMLAKVKGYPIDDDGNFNSGLAQRRGADGPAIVSLPFEAAFREPRD